MWAFVAAKGGPVYQEEVSRSADFNSWGAPITLRAEVPLVPLEGEGTLKGKWGLLHHPLPIYSIIENLIVEWGLKNGVRSGIHTRISNLFICTSFSSFSYPSASFPFVSLHSQSCSPEMSYLIFSRFLIFSFHSPPFSLSDLVGYMMTQFILLFFSMPFHNSHSLGFENISK